MSKDCGVKKGTRKGENGKADHNSEDTVLQIYEDLMKRRVLWKRCLRMYEKLIDAVKQWAEENRKIESVIIVGSYARGTNTDTSDLDLVILTPCRDEMVENQEFTELFGKITKRQTEYYGACTSVRVWYQSGMEVEFGLVKPSWIDVPLDPGTYQVLSDGYKVVLDKKSYFLNLKL